MDDLTIQKATEQEGMRGEVEKALAARTRSVINEVEKSHFRPHAFEGMRQLVVSGNALLHIPKDPKSPIRSFTLDQYVTRRDPEGFLLEFIIQEIVALQSLTGKARELADAKVQGKSEDNKKTLELYTHCMWDADTQKYTIHQELEGETVPESQGSYPKEAMEWLALRFTAIDGEDYGRGYIEEYIGDLMSLEGLTKAMVEGAAVSSKVVFFVRPNGVTKLSDVSRAANGDVKQGNADDISTLQVDKAHDLSTAKQLADDITQRLSFAFLMNTAIQRQGDRVTAEEIRYMARELEDSLGGVFSLMAHEFQLPVVKLYELRMEKAQSAPKLPKGVAAPAVVTGLEAIGRGNDLQNLDALLAGVAEIFGPEAVGRYVNAGEYIKRRGAALNVDTDGLINSEDDLAAQDQQAQMQQLMQQAAPEAIKQVGNSVAQSQETQE